MPSTFSFTNTSNFGKSKLNAGITNVATSLTVTSGHGAKFPASNFLAVIWGSAFMTPDDDTTAEIVLVTARSADTFTITRARESTTAKAWSANDNIMHVLTSGKMTELHNGIVTADNEWKAVNETWMFSSWDATTDMGVITVPTDATTRFSKGMRFQITQSGTVRYFIAHDVTATTIHGFFGTSYVLANAAISNISYTASPYALGFPSEPEKWTLETTWTISKAVANPAANTIYYVDTTNIQIGRGYWKPSCAWSMVSVATTANTGALEVGISTANNSFSNAELKTTHYSNPTGATANTFRTSGTINGKAVYHSATTTYYLVARNSAAISEISVRGDTSTAFIRFTSAYI